MGMIKLCYGTHYPIEDWREYLGLPTGKETEKKCHSCRANNLVANNFCGNCGIDIKAVCARLTNEEIIDISQEAAGVPPVPLQILVSNERVFICQVLSSGKGVISLGRPASNFPWRPIGEEVCNYAQRMGMPAEPPRILAFEEKES